MSWHHSAYQNVLRYLHTKLPRTSWWVLGTSESEGFWADFSTINGSRPLIKLLAITTERQSLCAVGTEFANTSIPKTANISLNKPLFINFYNCKRQIRILIFLARVFEVYTYKEFCNILFFMATERHLTTLEDFGYYV